MVCETRKTPIKKGNKRATNKENMKEVVKQPKTESEKEESKKQPGNSNVDTKPTEENNALETSKQKKATKEVYNIEALVERKGSKYLVQWENFPVDQNTWEPRSSIPDFILQV